MKWIRNVTSEPAHEGATENELGFRLICPIADSIIVSAPECRINLVRPNNQGSEERSRVPGQEAVKNFAIWTQS